MKVCVTKVYLIDDLKEDKEMRGVEGGMIARWYGLGWV